MRLTRIHPPSSLEPAKRARQLQHGTAIELSRAATSEAADTYALKKATWGAVVSPALLLQLCTAQPSSKDPEGLLSCLQRIFLYGACHW
jgi:hypothetical protein